MENSIYSKLAAIFIVTYQLNFQLDPISQTTDLFLARQPNRKRRRREERAGGTSG
jgi:hypothetical protein